MKDLGGASGLQVIPCC